MPNRVVVPLVIACALVSGEAAMVSAQPGDLEPACVSNVPRSLFFVGAGSGLGIVSSEEQSVYNKGISTIFDNGALIATGQADGPPVTPNLGTKTDWVPTVQIGYFQHFCDSDWLWGIKQSYSYLDTTTLTEHNLVIPQFGTSSDPDVSTFEGLSVTRSYEVYVDHQLILMPFFGRSFDHGFVYVGVGPSLSRVGARLNDVVGFATINEALLDISGRPQTVADTQWAFGVAASVGVTYFITPNWFLDISYTFSHPFPRTFHVESPFRNDAYSPLSFQGTLIGDYTANVNTHSITISLNVGF